MNRENLERYYHSLLPFKKLLSEGEISKEEFDKIEGFLAKKKPMDFGLKKRINIDNYVEYSSRGI